MDDMPTITPAAPALRPEWSMHLVMDVALNASTDSILEAHELQYHQFEKICESPVFVMQVATLRKQLEKEGATFKLKAQLQADHYLQKVHEMVMDPSMDPKVVTRLIEDVARWGGLDAPQAVGNGQIGGFSISINFSSGNDSRRGLTIDGDTQ